MPHSSFHLLNINFRACFLAFFECHNLEVKFLRGKYLEISIFFIH